MTPEQVIRELRRIRYGHLPSLRSTALTPPAGREPFTAPSGRANARMTAAAGVEATCTDF